MNAEAAKKLRKVFDPKTVGKLPRVTCKACSQSQDKVCAKHSKSKCAGCGNYITSAHIHLDYVGHAAVTDRLLEVDPGWTYRLLATNQDGSPVVFTNGLSDNVAKLGIWIELEVAGVKTPGFGEGKSFKEAISDAVRNAAMRRGVALDLWAKEDISHDEPEKVSAEPKQAVASSVNDPDFGPDQALLNTLGEIDVLADALAVTRSTDKAKVLSALSKDVPAWRTDPVDASRAKAKLVLWAEKAKAAA